jgi:NADH dehydrogenase
MPVVVTGASGMIGRLAVAAFGRASPEVRAYVRRKDAAAGLHQLGAKVAVGWIGDVENLAVVMSGAHTVCHLVGGMDPPTDEALRETNLTSTEIVLRAAREAGVARFLYLSYPGATPDSPNAYLKYKGLAERAIKDSALEHVILRTTHAYAPDGEWLRTMAGLARRRPPVVIGSGRQVLAPIAAGDVAAVLAAADDRETVRSGVWGLQGPDLVTADELADLLGGAGRRKLHLPPGVARLSARVTGRAVGRASTEIMAADSLADAPDAAFEFGVALTPLQEGLAAAMGSSPRPGPSGAE